jgi:hypothetical protein
LVGGPPGVELHTVVDELPSGDTGDMVPVALPTTIGEGMVPNGGADVIAVVLLVIDVEIVPGTVGTAMEGAGKGGTAGGCGVGTVEPGRVDMNDVAGCADSVSAGAIVLVDVEEVADAPDIVSAGEIDAIGPIAPPTADMEVSDTAGVPGAICPVGVEQVTTVPGVVGSEASGTGASVVSGSPGSVVAENGLGPLSGDVTIAPGIDGIPMAVVPMVETCARLAWQPSSRIAVVSSGCRMASASFQPI